MGRRPNNQVHPRPKSDRIHHAAKQRASPLREDASKPRMRRGISTSLRKPIIRLRSPTLRSHHEHHDSFAARRLSQDYKLLHSGDAEYGSRTIVSRTKHRRADLFLMFTNYPSAMPRDKTRSWRFPLPSPSPVRHSAHPFTLSPAPQPRLRRTMPLAATLQTFTPNVRAAQEISGSKNRLPPNARLCDASASPADTRRHGPYP
jgi:hypothetical protein